jgi:pimeloyl-ACP methyl ester carboxylesterase
MGALVSALAFPVPQREISEQELKARRNELVTLKTRAGNVIPAIHIQRRRRSSASASNNNSKFTIIYSHGNAEDVGRSLHYLDLLSEICQCSVFAYEYPGYSIADGEPSEENCYHAINAAYDYVTTTAGVDPAHVVLFGRSLGTGPTVDFCSRTIGIAGCILQSPLESGIRCAIGYYSSFTLYPLDIFRSYEKVSSIICPVFIMHGERDTVVPCDNGRALYATLQQRPCHSQVVYEPVWIRRAGHNDMPQVECLGHCRKFLAFLNDRTKN